MDDAVSILKGVSLLPREDGERSAPPSNLVEPSGARDDRTSTQRWEIAATGSLAIRAAFERASVEKPPFVPGPQPRVPEEATDAPQARRPSIAAYAMDRSGTSSMEANAPLSVGLVPGSPLLDLPASWRNRQTFVPPAAKAAGVVVSYSRRSSTRDSESIDRQIDGQVVYAESKGDVIKRSFVDKGISGATLIGREGLLRIVEMAKRGEISKVLVDDVSRIARSMSILASFYEELTDLGVEIHSVRKGGRLDLIDICIRGYLSVEERASIMRHCLDGRLRMASKGRWPGGPFFGYEAVAGEPGKLRVHSLQADIIRVIFALFVAGASCKMIADILNAEKVPSPKLKRWHAATINNMLRNPLYNGTLVFGRRRYFQNHRTGERWNVPAPMSAWTPSKVPDLRIVPAEVFAAVQDRLAGSSTKQGPRATRRTYVLSERVVCPSCKGILGPRSSRKGVPLIRCYAACDDRDVCDHVRLYAMDAIEVAALRLVRPLLGGEECRAEFLTTLETARSESLQSWQARKLDAERRAAGLRADLLAALRNADLAKGAANPAHLAFGVGEISRELEEAEDALAHCRSESRRLAPFDDTLRATLRDAFDGLVAKAPFRPMDEAGRHVFAALRDLIERVEILPVVGSRSIGLRVHVRLRHLLGLEEGAGADCVILDGEFEVDGRVARRATAHAAELAALLRNGHRFMTDDEWAVVEPAFNCYQPRGVLANVPRRKILDVILCCRRIALPFGQVPEDILGTCGKQLRRCVSHIVFHGHWSRVVAALQAHSPATLEGVEVAFHTKRAPNRHKQRKIPTRETNPDAPPLRAQSFIQQMLTDHEHLSTAEIDRAVQANGWSLWSSQKARAALKAQGLVVRKVKAWSLSEAERASAAAFVPSEKDAR